MYQTNCALKPWFMRD